VSESLLARYDALLLDLDGTVYRGEELIPAASEAISRARATGAPVRFVTNNASRTPEAVRALLDRLGIAIGSEEVDTSAQAGADVVVAHTGDDDAVLVLGTDALAREVACRGRTTTRENGGRVAAVVQGFSEEIGWRELAEACIAIRAGALWVACNADPTLPTERGLLPGNGSLVAALRTATDTAPLLAGKPGEALMRRSIAKAGAHRPLVIGDRLGTDIAGAAAVSADSLLVLTGVTSAADLLGAQPNQRPRYLLEDLRGLDKPAEQAEIRVDAGWQVERRGGELRLARCARSARPAALLRALCAVVWRAEDPPPAWSFVPADEAGSAALAALALA
jgi:HAD superfamily hydrolase (TIGR01450 family)